MKEIGNKIISGLEKQQIRGVVEGDVSHMVWTQVLIFLWVPAQTASEVAFIIGRNVKR